MTGQPYRLPAGGMIDRRRPVNFSFNGRRLTGFSGDTLASALLANGVHLVGRSFKYHRPRGILSAGTEEPNALVQLESGNRSVPNLKATRIELYEGLTATSVNCWPGVRFDAGALIDAAHRLVPAGFYYKTFMWPRGGWHFYERWIRRMAGMGRAPTGPDPDRYERMNAHCDVLVVGAGPAGMAAAQAAGRSGARVILADERSQPGGSLLNMAANGSEIEPDWSSGVAAELDSMKNVRVLSRTTVTGYFDHNFVIALQQVTDHLGSNAPVHLPRQRLWRIRAGRVVLATGALALYEFSGVGGALMGGTLSDRFGRRKMVAGAAICSALLMLVFVHVEGALMIPLLIGMGFTALSVSPVFLALVQDQLPENRATANGMFMLYAFGVRAINVMMVGALGDALGLQKAFIAAALISLLCLPVIITLPSTPAVSHEDL